MTDDRYQEAERSLEDDLRDVKILLDREEGRPVPLLLERHYGAPPREIAHVVVLLDDTATRRRLRARATAAFDHLGYVVAPKPGCDVYDVTAGAGAPSAHEEIVALARFQGLPRDRGPA